MDNLIKKNVFSVLCKLQIDVLCRLINKTRLLVVAYHGIYDNLDTEDIPLFTHLHADIFKKHLEFLRSHYHLMSLADLIDCFQNSHPIPERAAMVTLDDGFLNNYSVAYPILCKYKVPATIFLTVDYIGTNKLLWFDELFLLLKSAYDDKSISEVSELIEIPGRGCDLASLYKLAGSKLKKTKHEKREGILQQMRNMYDVSESRLFDQFKLLTWEQVAEMKSSGLVDFGVHTATHRIISGLDRAEWEHELLAPKIKIEQKLGCEINSFCFPNGVPDVDFFVEHEDYLARNGYVCAFTTSEKLNEGNDNCFRLGRLAVGSDMTSSTDYFRLNTSGLIPKIHSL